MGGFMKISDLPKEILPEIKKRIFTGAGVLILAIIISIIFKSYYFIIMGGLMAIAYGATIFTYIKAYQTEDLRVFTGVISLREKKLAPFSKNAHAYLIYCKDNEGNVVEISVSKNLYTKCSEGTNVAIYYITRQLSMKDDKSYSLQSYLKIDVN